MLRQYLTIILAIAVFGSGCSVPGLQTRIRDDLGYYEGVARSIEFPDVETPLASEPVLEPKPLTLRTDLSDGQFRDVTLDTVIRESLANSEVLRDLGGTVLKSPDLVRTIHGPALQATDPRFSVEAAQSAFDAQFSGQSYFEKNDRAVNNTFFGGGTRLLRQDLSIYQFELSKPTATGSEFSVRHNVDYDSNNAPGNRFPSAWNSNVEAEFRHPLLQGGGVNFNRIAGARAVPGVANGVLIARTNADIQLADFREGIRDFISNVENAYWDLYFAYRDVEVKSRARDSALETWRHIEAQQDRSGFEADKEAQAREQYYRFVGEVQNSISGRALEGTRTNNGSSGGSFRGTGGVYLAERRLRLLMGLPTTDGQLLRPSDDPLIAPVEFYWDGIRDEALTRRVELQRQRLVVQQADMELEASQNFLNPRLDAIGRYRWRGFGDNLLGGETGRFRNAYRNLGTNDFQEWQLGLELSFPLGFRRAHLAVANAEWKLARERAILVEQERQVVHNLANAVSEVERAFAVFQTQLNRREAAKAHLASLDAARLSNKARFEDVLDSQRRLAEVERQFYLALVEYSVAIKNVHFEKGALTDFRGIYIADDAEGDVPTPRPSAEGSPPPVPAAAGVDD